jgi:hypothetical protein
MATVYTPYTIVGPESFSFYVVFFVTIHWVAIDLSIAIFQVR